MIDFMGQCSWIGSTHGDFLAATFGFFDLVQHVIFLDNHGGHQHQVGPFPSRFRNRVNVSIDEFVVPLLGKNRCNGY